ncbi:hypothetical protein Gotur_022617 [Gossypium turneri]
MHQGSTIVSQLRPEFYDPRKAPFQASDLVLFEGSDKSPSLLQPSAESINVYTLVTNTKSTESCRLPVPDDGVLSMLAIIVEESTRDVVTRLTSYATETLPLLLLLLLLLHQWRSPAFTGCSMFSRTVMIQGEQREDGPLVGCKTS